MKIIECKPFADNKAHALKFDNGTETSAWGDKIDAGQLMQAFASQAEIEVELKPYTSKTGKQGTNLVSFKYVNPVACADMPIEMVKTGKIPSPIPSPIHSLMTPKDIQIIAQCMTKCATYGRNDVTIGMALDMYHEAVLSLEQNG